MEKNNRKIFFDPKGAAGSPVPIPGGIGIVSAEESGRKGSRGSKETAGISGNEV